MEQELALEVVRKQKAKKSHLTVPASHRSDIRTLCGVEMKAGDYDAARRSADCQPCLRKKGNRAFISSAYFAQDAGSRLLELSLKQSTAGHARPKDRGRPAKRKAPAAAGREASRPEQTNLDAPSDEELHDLSLAQLKQVGPLVHESPAGVLVRVQKRSGPLDHRRGHL